MSDFKERLEAERAELSDRLYKLNSFFPTEAFTKIDDVQQALLKVQAKAMATYLECLGERLERL